MNPTRNSLYLVRYNLDGGTLTSPCVGDDEVYIHSKMVEHCGARLESVCCLETELRIFIENVYLEGTLKDWLYEHE